MENAEITEAEALREKIRQEIENIQNVQQLWTIEQLAGMYTKQEK